MCCCIHGGSFRLFDHFRQLSIDVCHQYGKSQSGMARKLERLRNCQLPTGIIDKTARVGNIWDTPFESIFNYFEKRGTIFADQTVKMNKKVHSATRR